MEPKKVYAVNGVPHTLGQRLTALPTNPPPGTPVVCVDDAGVRRIREGQVYTLEEYDGTGNPELFTGLAEVSEGWYKSRFRVLVPVAPVAPPQSTRDDLVRAFEAAQERVADAERELDNANEAVRQAKDALSAHDAVLWSESPMPGYSTAVGYMIQRDPENAAEYRRAPNLSLYFWRHFLQDHDKGTAVRVEAPTEWQDMGIKRLRLYPEAVLAAAWEEYKG